ncbi:MAG: DUF1801 domain-containing protein [Pseudomonadota bacterium]|nr:DUF1801 domain-containing protein [Pseudomonadota bacterium]
MTDTVETYLESLSPEDLARVNRLRGIVRTAGPDLVEDIKWNAPNFSRDGTDCVTLGIERKGGVRMVLHRGARARTNAGLSFDDPDGLAKWPAADRGVVVLRSLEEIAEREDALVRLVTRWIDAIGTFPHSP